MAFFRNFLCLFAVLGFILFLPQKSSGENQGPPQASIYFYHLDHLQSSSAITDGKGHLIQREVFAPYGSKQYSQATATTILSHKFTGQIFDAETDLHFFKARYYDSTAARFVSADSVVPDFENPQALNRYSYTFNNPLRYTDPSGHSPWDALAAVAKFASIQTEKQFYDFLYPKMEIDWDATLRASTAASGPILDSLAPISFRPTIIGNRASPIRDLYWYRAADAEKGILFSVDGYPRRNALFPRTINIGASVEEPWLALDSTAQRRLGFRLGLSGGRMLTAVESSAGAPEISHIARGARNGRLVRAGSRSLVVAAAGYDAYQLGSLAADGNWSEFRHEGARTAGRWAGAWAGAKFGAAAFAWAGPWGVALGGIGFGIAGSFAGEGFVNALLPE